MPSTYRAESPLLTSPFRSIQYDGWEPVPAGMLQPGLVIWLPGKQICKDAGIACLECRCSDRDHLGPMDQGGFCHPMVVVAIKSHITRPTVILALVTSLTNTPLETWLKKNRYHHADCDRYKNSIPIYHGELDGQIQQLRLKDNQEMLKQCYVSFQHLYMAPSSVLKRFPKEGGPSRCLTKRSFKVLAHRIGIESLNKIDWDLYLGSLPAGDAETEQVATPTADANRVIPRAHASSAPLLHNPIPSNHTIPSARTRESRQLQSAASYRHPPSHSNAIPACADHTSLLGNRRYTAGPNYLSISPSPYYSPSYEAYSASLAKNALASYRYEQTAPPEIPTLRQPWLHRVGLAFRWIPCKILQWISAAYTRIRDLSIHWEAIMVVVVFVCALLGLVWAVKKAAVFICTQIVSACQSLLAALLRHWHHAVLSASHTWHSVTDPIRTVGHVISGGAKSIAETVRDAIEVLKSFFRG